jgi:hypothetical protein
MMFRKIYNHPEDEMKLRNKLHRENIEVFNRLNRLK